MEKFNNWLATSPIAQVLKYSVGALAAILIDSLSNFNLPPEVFLAITGLVPLIIDYLNSSDPRFGKGSKPTIVDVVKALEPAIEAAVPAKKKKAVKAVADVIIEESDKGK